MNLYCDINFLYESKATEITVKVSNFIMNIFLMHTGCELQLSITFMSTIVTILYLSFLKRD
jgi:hypothetical protein